MSWNFSGLTVINTPLNLSAEYLLMVHLFLCFWSSWLFKKMFGGIIWTNDSALLTQNDLRTGLSGSPPQLAALMDSFATSQSFLHTVFSLDWSAMSANRLQLTAGVLFHLEGQTSALNGAGRDTCWQWKGPVEPRALRSSENRRSGRLKGLNSETQLRSPETEWPLPPWVTDIPANPRAAYLFA